MPELSRFYGIVIMMYYDDHNPPHFHAEYAGEEVTIEIDTLEVGEGQLPRRALNLVREWAKLHREELHVAWQQMVDEIPLDKIEPLS